MGLFAGEGARPMDDAFAAYAWTNDQRIAGLTGQPFSDEYRRRVLGDRSRPFDSGPATLAITAMIASASERAFEACKNIQQARFVSGRDITDTAVLSSVLRDMGLRDAAASVEAPNETSIAAYHQKIGSARSEMQHYFGIDGVPALIVGEGEKRHLVRPAALFGGMDGLIEILGQS